MFAVCMELLMLAVVLMVHVAFARIILNHDELQLVNVDPEKAAQNAASDRIMTETDSRPPAYAAFANYIKQGMDKKVDPCSDFYGFVCGNYNYDESTVSAITNSNARKMAEALKTFDKRKLQSRALEQANLYYKKCVQFHTDRHLDSRRSAWQHMLREFTAITGLHFPMLEPTYDNQDVTPKKLGRALGYLSSHILDTLITPMVISDFENPKKYRMYIDPPKLSHGTQGYYGDVAWNYTESWFLRDAGEALHGFSVMVANISSWVTTEQLEELFDFETTLARDYTRNHIKRLYADWCESCEKIQMQDDEFFIDFREFFAIFFRRNQELTNHIRSKNFSFTLREPQLLRKLSKDFTLKFNQKTVLNYLFLRLLKRYRNWLVTVGQGSAEVGCAQEVSVPLPLTTQRFFVESFMQEEPKTAELLKMVQNVKAEVQDTLKAVLRQLFAGSPTTLTAALTKLEQLQFNLGYRPRVMNNAELDLLHQTLDLKPEDSYQELYQKAVDFYYDVLFGRLARNTNVNRYQFSMAITEASGAYVPIENVMNIPLGIVSKPLVNIDYPLSVNYGSIGCILGHELAHAFDDVSVRADGYGRVVNWMDRTSAERHKRYTQCLIDQYGRYCYKDGLCTNGAFTLNENFADNIGMIAAWAAYKDVATGRQMEPTFSDPLLNNFTHDQLFFISFARHYCQKPHNQAQATETIVSDSHSPNYQRVLGTLHNFPVFREVFNCPAPNPKPSSKFCSIL